MAKILIIEDDSDTAKTLRDYLQFERYTVEHTANGTDGAYLLCNYDYDLAIVDWQLPELSGYEIVRQLRSSGRSTPVLMLTARSAVSDKEAGLDAGADDYLTKPFDVRELSARIRAVLRRPNQALQNVLRAGRLELDSKSGIVTYEGKEIKLMPTEYALLEFLIRHPNEVFSVETLLDRVWQSSSDVSIAAVRTYVTRLRKKLAIDKNAPRIETVHGFGYRFEW